MSIHSGNPFLPPPQDRDQGRRLRARLGGTVTLWTAGHGTGRRGRAGLTVSSMLLVDGPAWQALAVLDPDSDLVELLARGGPDDAGTAVVQFLGPGQELLADAFAGLAPAPGGPFTLGQWESTTWGPRLIGADTWAGVRLDQSPELVGYSVLVRARVEHVEVGPGPYLTHHGGRYGSTGG